MASVPQALPDDVASLKAALVAERAGRLEADAELAVARAKASEDTALIAAQKLRIAKLERQIYGQRSERSARLIEQLSLQFEELAAGATQDELAAEMAVAKITNVRAFTRRTPESLIRNSLPSKINKLRFQTNSSEIGVEIPLRPAFPSYSPARCRGIEWLANQVRY